MEASLIKKYQPKYNTVWRDGKSHNYVFITKPARIATRAKARLRSVVGGEAFPRVFVGHQLSTISHELLTAIGPFIDGNSLKQTLRILRRIFPFRTCNKLPKKPCLYKQLNLCPAPCLEYEKDYRQKKCVNPCRSANFDTKKSYAKNIKNLIAILNGKKNSVIKNLQKEMQKASQQQNFERAKVLRDQTFALENVFSHSHILEKEGGSLLPRWKKGTSFQKLQKLLGLEIKIKRIEGYDISNTQGQEATGSIVVFKNGHSNKNEYRKFKIKITGKPNDTAMLKEVISRRLKHKEWPMPQVMLIDGGRGQLNAALDILKEKNGKAQPFTDFIKVKVVALAKRDNELFIEGKNKLILLKTLPQEVSNLILQVRDEAHRFAITYHKKLRNKAFLD